MTSAGRQVLALVPARGGSKGVARKNLRVVAGKPLVQYTLQAALAAKVVDQVFLSSDDAEILALGASTGATPVRRPAEFASDTASATDVVKHFLSMLGSERLAGDPYLVYLQPTSPLRTSAHIDEAFELMRSRGGHTLLSVVELEKSPYKTFSIDSQGRLQSLFEERLSNARRQDLPATYLPNGAMYVFRVSDFTSRDGFPSNGSIPYLMTASSSIDVDVEQDIERLERILGEAHG
jgi:CMP-N,N'-diacetyllegionaminic acid synthase